MLCALLLSLVQAHLEDFEARTDLAAPADGWERVRADGFPAYNAAALEEDPTAPSGRRVLVLSTQGGAVGVRRSAPWPVDAARPWRLDARVRVNARRNAARVAVEWTDSGRVVLREDLSEPVGPGDAWTSLSLEIPVPPRAATGARVRLEFAGSDVRGDARFDALRFAPVVRLELSRDDAGLRLLLRGAPPGPQVAALSVLDAAQPSFRLENGRPADLPMPALPPGTYVLRADCAGASARLVVAIPDPALAGRPRAMELLIDPSAPGDAVGALRLGGFARARIAVDAAPGRVAELLATLADVDARVVGESSAPPSALAGTIEDWVERGDATLLASGTPAELVRRAVAAAGPLLVSSRLSPEAIAALRTADERLSGARPRAAGPAQAAFERDGKAILVFWSDAPVQRVCDFGDGVRWVPSIGAVRPHTPGETIRIDELPLFAVGVDPARLDLQAGLSLADPRVFLRRAPTALELRVRNPGPSPLTELRVRFPDAPAGWDLSMPAPAPATLAPGAELRVAPSLRPGADAATSALALRVELTFTRDGRPERITAALPLEAAPLLEVSLEQRDRTATMKVRNRGERPALLLARVRLPGQAEQLEPLGALAPGATKSIDYDLGPAGAAEIEVEERGGGRAFARGRFEIR